MPKSRVLAIDNSSFLERVCDYLPMDAVIRTLCDHGQPGPKLSCQNLQENSFFLFDAETLLAVSHAIEELALEEGNGTLFLACQDFKHFEPHRERYWQVAATIEEALVTGQGAKPRRHGHLKFVPLKGNALATYWILHYRGKNGQVLFACRQTNQARRFDDKDFTGFYTLNAKACDRIRAEVDAARAGKLGSLPEFDRQLALDCTAKRVAVEFFREQTALTRSIRRLQLQDGQNHRQQFLKAMEQSLQRLTELKTTLLCNGQSPDL